MTKSILMIVIVGMLSACVSGKKPPETYVGRDGRTTIIENDVEMCKRSCNDDYSRCMDMSSGVNNDGIKGSASIFGASSECRASLKGCLQGCK